MGLLLATATASVFSLLVFQKGGQARSDSQPPQQTVDDSDSLAQSSVKLNHQQAQEVKADCLSIIEEDLIGVENDWRQKDKEYQELTQTVEASLGFVADNLRSMGKDASFINLATSQNQLLKSRFKTESKAYRQSLLQIIALNDDCQNQPQAFVAALFEANSRRQKTRQAAQDILDFISGQLQEAFAEVDERLVEESVEQ